MSFDTGGVKGCHNVVIAFVPNWTREKAEELRDCIAESLPLGCAVVPEEGDYHVVALPDLGGVRVWSGCDFDLSRCVQLQEGLNVYEKDGLTYVEAAGDQKAEPEPAVAPENKRATSTSAKVAAEKQAILARLKQWREDHGPGCLDAVAKKAGHGITPEMLRGLCLGEVKLLIEDWRHIKKALDQLEAEERKAAGNG